MKLYFKPLLAALILMTAAMPGAYGSNDPLAALLSARNNATEYTIAANLKANDTPPGATMRRTSDFPARDSWPATIP